MFTFLACCPTLNVLLKNDVKDKWDKFEGVYTFQGLSDGIDYWVDAKGENAIWYYREINTYYWVIAPIPFLGTLTVSIFSSSPASSATNSLVNKCPNNEGYISSWNYYNDGISFIPTNDVYIKCATEDDFCTYENPCGTNEGDCDTHEECQDGFSCGSNNCPDYLGFDSQFDCCYVPAVGDEHFCTTNNPCAVDEGDCDSDNECQANLFCDFGISCPGYLGFAPDINCCISETRCKAKKNFRYFYFAK